jgi:hypothetical protein
VLIIYIDGSMTVATEPEDVGESLGVFGGSNVGSPTCHDDAA